MNAVFLQGVPVWAVAATLPIALLVAWVLSSLARWLLRGRAKLGTATSIVIAILCIAVGLALAGWIDPNVNLWSPLTILLGLGVTVAGIAGYGAVAAHFQRPQRAGIAELLAAGESEQVEFNRPLG